MTHPAEHLACRVAEEAHAGQVDKAGQPYIGHVERVVARLSDPSDRAVAWLHDVAEDTEWEPVDLLLAGSRRLPRGDLKVWMDVVADVNLLTHRRSEPREDSLTSPTTPTPNGSRCSTTPPGND